MDSSVPGNFVQAALTAWTRFILRWRWLTVIVVLGAAALGLDFARQNLEVNTNTADMMSPSLDWRQDFIAYRDAFEARNANIVAVVDAQSEAQAVAFARSLAEALRGEPQYFRTVFLAGDGDFFEQNGLLYMSVDELEALSDQLAGAQPLIGMISERGNGVGVIETLARVVAEAGSTGQGDADSVGMLYSEVAQTLSAAADGRTDIVDWQSLITRAPLPIEQRMILIQPELDATRVRPARPALERLRTLASELAVQAPGQPVTRLTGTIAMEDEELESVVDGASFAGIAALIMVTVVLLITLRSARLLLVSLVTLLSGLAGTAAFAAATVVQLNLLSVAFAVLYVGLGVDFILHVVLRVRELQREGIGRDDSIVASMRGVGSSLMICAITTAAGFFAFIPTSFTGVSQLGLISGAGMFVSLFASLSILPALLGLLLPAPVSRPASAMRQWITTHSFSAPPGRVLGVAGAVVIGAACLLPAVQFDSSPIRLRDPNSESIQVLDALAERADAGFMSLVALADDSQTAAQWAQALQDLPQVSRVSTLDSLVPDNQEDKLFVLDDTALMLGSGFGAFERRPADAEAMRDALLQLQTQLRQAQELSEAESNLLSAVTAVLGSEPDAGRLQDLDQSLVGELPEELDRLASGLDARGFEAADLPQQLRSRWSSSAGVQLIEISPSGDINDPDVSAEFVAAVRGVVPRATGLPVVYSEASKTVVESFRLALTYAFIVVTIILLGFMRSIKDCVLVLVPILCAAIVTAGMTVVFGLSFNFANIIALPLLVGVGVDSGIHMVHRMRTEPSGSGMLGTSTSRAVVASILTTIASFGNLAFSRHVGMSSMGVLLTLGMAITLVATLWLLPALVRYSENRKWIS